MTCGKRLLVAAAALGLCLLPAVADAAGPVGEFGESRARVRLVTDTTEIEPGSTSYLGVVFEIEPGWHIYWRNPGGAGLATDIQWQLPEGFEAGDLQWPLPIAFTQSEGIPGYGYEGSVVLAAEVRAPLDYDAKRPHQIRAKVSWLACRGVCVLGAAELEGSLAALPVDQEAFRGREEDLPRAADPGRPPFSVTTTGGFADGRLSLWLHWPTEPRLVEWFPDPSDALRVEEISVQTRGDLTRIDAVVRPLENATGATDRLDSLVVLTGPEGGRHGWELVVDLDDENP